MQEINQILAGFFSSYYEHGVDEKRRVQIPHRWLNGNKQMSFALLVWPTNGIPDACILVLPPDVWQKLVLELKEMRFADPRSETLRRLIGTKSFITTSDKAGRICLPDWMTKAVGINDKALLVGLVDRFQIWSPERYKQIQAQDEKSSAEAFSLI
jgi:MraZ protein